MDQQSTYRTGAKAAPNTVNGPWELQTVKSEHGTYVLRFNLTTGDCFYLDLRTIANGWRLVPSDMVISDTGVTAGTKSHPTDKVTAGSI